MEGKWIEVDANGVGWRVDCYRSGQGTVYDHEQTNRVQIPIVIKNFCCPVCGSKKFESLYEKPEFPLFTENTLIGPEPMAGSPSFDCKYIIGYRCPGCTTRFDDPTKFSKNKPAKIVPPTPTLDPMEQFWAKELQQKIERSGGRDVDPSHRIENALMESISNEMLRLRSRLPATIVSKRKFSPNADSFCALCGTEDLGRNGWGGLADPCPTVDEVRSAYDEKKRQEATAQK